MTVGSRRGAAGGPSRPGAVLCGLRGGVLGVVALLLTYVGHVQAGGDPASARGLVVPAVFSVGLSLVLSRRRLSFLALLTALAGSQVGFHLWFARRDLLSSVGHGPPQGTSSAAMGHMHGGLVLMVACHLVAAVLAAQLLLVGEDGLWDLLSLVASRLWVAVALPVLVTGPVRGPLVRLAAPADVASWASRLAGSVQPRRGPPEELPV